MTHVIRVANVNNALEEGLRYLTMSGERSRSRNGDVVRAPGPVVTEYTHPWDRVLISVTRDANPFFHLFESIWMLAGRNDVTFVQKYASRMASFSDDGETLNGAYGHRWRVGFEFDQLLHIIDYLKNDPTGRRAVLEMWHPYDLLAVRASKDVPCNTHIYFQRRGEKLDMTVCCRSNDMIWGAYGANAVHMSVLLEFMAHMLGLRMGLMRQFSLDMHVYTEHFPETKWGDLIYEADVQNPYTRGALEHQPLFHDDYNTVIHKCVSFCEGNHISSNDFFGNTLMPMRAAWESYKQGDFNQALNLVDCMEAWDWRLACRLWVIRRRDASALRAAGQAGMAIAQPGAAQGPAEGLNQC